MCDIKEKTLHIAMYPYFAMGHLTSFLHLANKLAERGHQISFIIPSKTQPKLTSHNHHPNLITFIPITVPHVDGLPTGAETTNDVPASDRPKITEAMDLTQETIDSYLGLLKPDYVFFDRAHWLPRLAQKHGVKSLHYVTSYIINSAYISFDAYDGNKVNKADLMVTPPGFPSSDIRLRGYEAQALAYIGNIITKGGMTIAERHSICHKESDVLAYKTCKEMEGEYYDFVKKNKKHKSILLVGPVIPEPPTSKLDDQFDGWLNGFTHGTVVFCALGSESVLEKNQFQELVHALELTGRPFVAALRPPKGSETIEAALPDGYIERTKQRGIIYGGWVQQQLILHHPSVGCFITHCGAGSLSEGLLSECQLVLLPQAVDQFLNARLMSVDLRVGVEVDKGEDDGFFTKEAICEAVRTVMEIENQIGKEVRANHTKWRNTLLKDGLEDNYINGFVKSLQDMLG